VRVTVRLKDGSISRITHIPQIYGLVGYQNSAAAMVNFGLIADPATGRLNVNQFTGRAANSMGHSRIYVAGNAASQIQDRNQEVIPGIARTVPFIAMSEIIAAESAIR
jgi:hypothetical protein